MLIGKATATGNRLGEIERLRGIAVMLVLTVHIEYFQMLLPQFLIWNGRVGVDLFFVISGYVVTLSLRREREISIGSIGKFYLRRFFRLVPIALVWMAAELGLAILFDAIGYRAGYFATPALAVAAISRILLLENNPGVSLGHFWSLIVEWHFYLALPLVLAMVPRRWHLPVVAMVVVGFAIWFDVRPGYWGAYFHTPQRVVQLGLGVLLAIGSHPVQKAPAPLFWRIVGGPALVALLWCAPSLFSADFGAAGPQLIAYGLIGTLIVWLASRGRGLVFGFRPVDSILERLGTLSYAIYVCHYTLWFGAKVIISTYAITVDPLIGLPLQLSFTIGIAMALNRWIERPGISLGNRLLEYLRQHRDVASPSLGHYPACVAIINANPPQNE